MSSVQFISVIQSGQTLHDPLECSIQGYPIHHQILDLTQTHVHGVSDAIQPSCPLLSPFPHAFSLSKHHSFLMSQFSASGGQHVVASTSVLTMNTQDWFPLRLTGLSSLQSKGLQEYSSTKQFKSISFSAFSFLYIPTLTSIHDYWILYIVICLS